LVVDRTVEGETTEAVHEAVVNEIHRALGIVGHISVLGRTLTWSPADPGADQRKIVITVMPGGGQTRIHIEERLELSGWRIFIPGWGVGVGLVTGLLTALALGLNDEAILFTALPLGFVGAFTAVQLYFGIGGRQRTPQLESLAERLTKLVSEAAHPALPKNRGL
jgi:hypothetical protein